LVASYIEALDLSAIIVLAPAAAGELSLIRTGLDPVDVAARESERTGQELEIAAVRWCANVRRVETLVGMIEAAFPRTEDGWLATSAIIAKNAIDIVAHDNRIVLYTDEGLRNCAEAAVRAVDQQIEAMRARGDWRRVSRCYKAYRLARTAAGEKAQPWAAWFANYKAEMVRAAAMTAAELRREPLAPPFNVRSLAAPISSASSV
jgi:hypothetical protein